MITGVNAHHPAGGTDFHIQIEDLEASMELDARVYVSGRVVFHKRVSYRSAVAESRDPEEAVTTIQEELQRLLSLIKAAIGRGKITA